MSYFLSFLNLEILEYNLKSNWVGNMKMSLSFQAMDFWKLESSSFLSWENLSETGGFHVVSHRFLCSKTGFLEFPHQGIPETGVQ